VTFRKLIFWPHLIAGSLAGIVILIMSVTGVLLTYERQIIDWADMRSLKPAPTALGSPRLEPEELIAKVRESAGSTPVAITIRSEESAPVAFSYGREKTIFVDSRSGEVLGEGSAGTRKFFREMTVWHRWLGAEAGPSQATGKAITGASNLMFLFLVMSGFYLWFPRQWTWQHLKPITWFRGGLSGKARDFNWHNVFGFWMAIPLFFVVVSATMFSYPWATQLVYTLTGTEAPAPIAKGKGGEGKKRKGSAKGEKKGAPAALESLPADAPLDGLNAAIGKAQDAVPGWLIVSARIGGPLSITVDKAERGRPDLRSAFAVDRETGDLRLTESFSGYNTGRRVRTWLRWIHTGEAGGFAGQTLAGIASLAGVFLVYTGIALALRRFAAWRERSRRPERRESEPEPAAARR